MVPKREALVDKAFDAIDSLPDINCSFLDGMKVARAVVDTLLPEITDPKQLLGVPEGSILYVERKNETFFYTWRGGHLHNLGGAFSFTPEYVLQWGPLTVVWMP